MTVREFAAFARGRARAQLDERKRALWAAWYGAHYARMKRMPDLDKEFRKLERGGRRVTKSPQQLLAMAEQLNKLFGGTDNRKKD